MDSFRTELVRMARVTDMLNTAHSCLSVRYHRIAGFIETVVLLVSVAVFSLTFYDPTNKDPILLRDIVLLEVYQAVPVIGAVIFVISILQLRYNFRGSARLHEQASTTMGRLKIDLNSLKSVSDQDLEKVRDRIVAQYTALHEVCPKIPDERFLRLKKKHLAKVRVSKVLDKYPHSSIWLLKINFFLRDNKKVLCGGRTDGQRGTSKSI